MTSEGGGRLSGGARQTPGGGDGLAGTRARCLPCPGGERRRGLAGFSAGGGRFTGGKNSLLRESGRYSAAKKPSRANRRALPGGHVSIPGGRNRSLRGHWRFFATKNTCMAPRAPSMAGHGRSMEGHGAFMAGRLSPVQAMSLSFKATKARRPAMGCSRSAQQVPREAIFPWPRLYFAEQRPWNSGGRPYKSSRGPCSFFGQQ